jgi:hypothetical protein
VLHKHAVGDQRLAVDELGPTASNPVVLAVPVEILQLVQKFAKTTME